MDIASATLIGFSSILAVGSLTVIVMVNYRRCCKKKENNNTPIDWAVVTNNIIANP
jgi:hypothetical protein